MLESSGKTGQVMRRPGPRQGTAVCAHTVRDVEQFNHKVIHSVFTEAMNLWIRVASLLTPWCAEGEVPTGVNHCGQRAFLRV